MLNYLMERENKDMLNYLMVQLKLRKLIAVGTIEG